MPIKIIPVHLLRPLLFFSPPQRKVMAAIRPPDPPLISPFPTVGKATFELQPQLVLYSFESCRKKTNKEAEIELAELRSNKSEGIDTVLILGQIADSNLQAVPSLMSEEEKRRMEIELEAERAAASEARLKIAELEAKIASTQLESKTSSSENLLKEMCELRDLSECQAARIKELEGSESEVSSAKDKALTEANETITRLEAQMVNLQKNSATCRHRR
ncbi:hypothetical protein Aperf_G00000054221 [Anoplocephala perfoliata]